MRWLLKENQGMVTLKRGPVTGRQNNRYWLFLHDFSESGHIKGRRLFCLMGFLKTLWSHIDASIPQWFGDSLCYACVCVCVCVCVCECVHSELSDILRMWWFSQCPGSKEMAHSKGLSVNDHLDVGRVSQGGVVRFPGLGWSSEKEEGAYQSPVRAGLWSYGEHSHCLSSSKQGRKMRSNYSSLSLFPPSLFMLLPLTGQTQTEASVQENPGEQGKGWRTTCWLEGLLSGRKV